MEIKNGVYTRATVMRDGLEVNIEPSAELKAAFRIVDEVSRKMFNRGIVITSMFDGTHGIASLHYSGNAFDIRIWIYPKNKRAALVTALKKALGINYDVVLEGDHIHIEFDPKK